VHNGLSECCLKDNLFVQPESMNFELHRQIAQQSFPKFRYVPGNLKHYNNCSTLEKATLYNFPMEVD